MSNNVSKENWHLSKSVPVTLIFAILLQTVAFVWFMSDLSSTVETNTKTIAKHDAEIAVMERAINSQAVTLGRIDENMSEIRRALVRLENRLARDVRED